jgi:hypothetical protein
LINKAAILNDTKETFFFQMNNVSVVEVVRIFKHIFLFSIDIGDIILGFKNFTPPPSLPIADWASQPGDS